MKKLSLINKQFIEAAENNQLDELKNLLSQGSDIHADDGEALIFAAIEGHLEVVKLLVLPDIKDVNIINDVNVYYNNDEH